MIAQCSESYPAHLFGDGYANTQVVLHDAQAVIAQTLPAASVLLSDRPLVGEHAARDRTFRSRTHSHPRSETGSENCVLGQPVKDTGKPLVDRPAVTSFGTTN